jgi:hypothetical protein
MKEFFNKNYPMLIALSIRLSIGILCLFSEHNWNFQDIITFIIGVFIFVMQVNTEDKL